LNRSALPGFTSAIYCGLSALLRTVENSNRPADGSSTIGWLVCAVPSEEEEEEEEEEDIYLAQTL